MYTKTTIAIILVTLLFGTASWGLCPDGADMTSYNYCLTESGSGSVGEAASGGEYQLDTSHMYPLFVAYVESPVRISGSAYLYPQAPPYKATVTLDVTASSPPSGAFQYYYAKTRMNFVSTSITTVSTSEGSAEISGEGKVNGTGGYTFTANVIDGAPDQFGITILNSGGGTYYSIVLKEISGGDLKIE